MIYTLHEPKPGPGYKLPPAKCEVYLPNPPQTLTLIDYQDALESYKEMLQMKLNDVNIAIELVKKDELEIYGDSKKGFNFAKRNGKKLYFLKPVKGRRKP